MLVVGIVNTSFQILRFILQIQSREVILIGILNRIVLFDCERIVNLIQYRSCSNSRCCSLSSQFIIAILDLIKSSLRNTASSSDQRDAYIRRLFDVSIHQCITMLCSEIDQRSIQCRDHRARALDKYTACTISNRIRLSSIGKNILEIFIKSDSNLRLSCGTVHVNALTSFNENHVHIAIVDCTDIGITIALSGKNQHCNGDLVIYRQLHQKLRIISTSLIIEDHVRKTSLLDFSLPCDRIILSLCILCKSRIYTNHDNRNGYIISYHFSDIRASATASTTICCSGYKDVIKLHLCSCILYQFYESLISCSLEHALRVRTVLTRTVLGIRSDRHIYMQRVYCTRAGVVSDCINFRNRILDSGSNITTTVTSTDDQYISGESGTLLLLRLRSRIFCNSCSVLHHRIDLFVSQRRRCLVFSNHIIHPFRMCT
nr:MAG TPA: hypothetical protein [Caudoviricetes sp.]